MIGHIEHARSNGMGTNQRREEEHGNRSDDKDRKMKHRYANSRACTIYTSPRKTYMVLLYFICKVSVKLGLLHATGYGRAVRARYT